MNQVKHFNIAVGCYAGYRGEESPRSFYLGERMIKVEKELDRWIDPNHRYFKVKGNDGGTYILRHDIETEQWEMTLFDGGNRSDTALYST